MTSSASSSPSATSSELGPRDGQDMRARPSKSLVASGVLAASLALSAPLVGLAQDPAPRIAYVDMTRVINESSLFVAGRARLTEEFGVRNEAFKLEEARLRELDGRRDREIAGLSSLEAEELKAQIATLERSIGRQRSELNLALNRRMKEMTDGIDRRIREEIGAYARAQGLDLVLTDGVGFANPKLDITDDVLKRINGRAGEVRVP